MELFRFAYMGPFYMKNTSWKREGLPFKNKQKEGRCEKMNFHKALLFYMRGIRHLSVHSQSL